MELDKPFYLIFVRLNREHRDLVDINVRESDAPEETAENHSVTIEEFRRIFRDAIRTPVDQLEADIEKLQMGHGFTINFIEELESIRRAGLLPSRAS
jgi:hypothetical protein